MEITTLTDLLSNFAFPVAVVIILILAFAKVLKSYKESVDSQKEDVKELNKMYHEDSIKVNEALNNNTNAINNMTKLIDTLVREKIHHDES